jgi:nitrogenase-stabilizing/protective protein
MIELPQSLADLDTAEAFLNHFAVPYEPHVVNVCRLHILQRFHDYLAEADDDPTNDATTRMSLIRSLLVRAYDDFVRSDPLTERVFKVLQTHSAPPAEEPARTFVPLDSVLGPTRTP